MVNYHPQVAFSLRCAFTARFAASTNALQAWLGSCRHPQQSTHTEPLSSPSERHLHNEDMRPVDRDPRSDPCNKIFHKYMDQSVTEFIRILRIEKSIILMKESSEILLKDLSLMVGYDDASYFSKVFKATKGVSPLKYRELRL